MKFSIYRFNPEAEDAKPYMQDYDVALEPTNPAARACAAPTP